MPEALNPYAPPKAAVDLPVAAPQLELASRAARLGAAIVDGIAVGGVIVFGAIIHPLGLFVGAAAIGAANLWTLHRARATLGKMALDLRIVRADGSEAELWRIVFLRWLPMTAIGVIPYVGILGLVDVLFIFGAARRCLHDYIADTVVIDAK